MTTLGTAAPNDRRAVRTPDAVPARLGGTAGLGPDPDEPELLAHGRRLMARHGLTPASARPDLERVAETVLRRFGQAGDAPSVTALTAVLAGWGPLQPLFDAEDVEEIWWNDPSRVFVARRGLAELTPIALTEPEARAIVQRAVTHCGRRLDTSHPFVDTQLPDGSRLHVAIPPITARHWAVNVRRHIVRPTTLDELVGLGTLTDGAAEVVGRAVLSGANVVVSGGTHTGKTTTVNALLGAAAADRVVTCEEVRELDLPHADWVALQTRDPGLEGTGGVALRDLVRESLRMRPSRIVVGEVRGPEALDLLLAMNCGVPAAATIHANSSADAIDKLTGLALLAAPNVSADFVSRTVGSCVDLVIHLGLSDSGERRVQQVATVSPGPDRPRVGQLFRREGGALIRAGAEMPDFAGWLPQ